MNSQRGATAIEFALIASIFLMLVIGILECARLMMQINTVAAVSQILARAASVCDVKKVNQVSFLNQLMPGLPAELISVEYLPSGCDTTNCQWVQVKTQIGISLDSVNPFINSSLSWPALIFTLPRESLSHSASYAMNPLCSW
jgi:Flp pilus assembly pilin Flp